MKAVAVLLFSIAALSAAEDVPQWVRDAAAAQVPSYPVKVANVVLFQEEQLTVDSDGRRVMRERGAARVLQQAKHRLIAFRTYNTKAGKIREFQAWLLRPGERPYVFPKNAATDVALSRDYTYDEARARLLDPGHDLPPGTVFAWDIVEEEKTVFTQYHYTFQESSPVLLSRFVLTVPPSWEVSGVMMNHTPLTPQVAGNTYTWELRDLPWIEPEEWSPSNASLVPRLGINYFPASDARPELHPLRNWAATSAWLTGFSDPAATVTDAVRSKALELTAGAATEADKLRRLGKFVQKTNYVEVAMNVERGGGYTPHPADEVLARNYGDCKDKAALMRALLAAVGIKSYAITIYSGDRHMVRPEWPSTWQFNHAIVAIVVSKATAFPAVLEDSKLGRLLIFDPTSAATPLGDLPEYEQDSYALIQAGDQGELVRMPLLPSSENRIESTAEAQLGLDGRLTAHIAREYFGQSARSLRSSLQRDTQAELTKRFEAGLARRLGGMTLERLQPADHFDDNRLDLNLDLQVRQFGQFMQQKMLMVSPGALLPEVEYALPAKQRTWPVQLYAEVRKDSVNIALPAEFKVDEIPDPMKIDSPYGSYRAEWKVNGAKLSFVQSLEIKDATAPASEYAAIREFFENVTGAQHSAVVLLKQ